MFNPLRISVVSYLNALPFKNGFSMHDLPPGWTVSMDIPSECARKLIDREADLGLIPVAMIPALGNRAHPVTNYGIGADGDVASVMLFSNEPPGQLTSVILDRESRTSVALARILADKYWKIKPEWIHETGNDFNNLPPFTGAVVIGDRALSLRGNYRYETDLGGEWKKFSGLPFIFACWVCTRPLDAEEEEYLNEIFRQGLDTRAEIAVNYKGGNTFIDIHDYLFINIRYELDDEARKGLKLFLNYLQESNA